MFNLKIDLLPIQLVYKYGDKADMILSCLPQYELSSPPFCLPDVFKEQTFSPCEDVGFMNFDVNDDYLKEWREEIPGLIEPKEEHIQLAFDWGQKLKEKTKYQDMYGIVHCHMGVSRSPAFLFCIFCDWYGEGQEEKAFNEVMKLNSNAFPNPYIIQIADRYMKRNGKMIRQILKLKENS